MLNDATGVEFGVFVDEASNTVFLVVGEDEQLDIMLSAEEARELGMVLIDAGLGLN